MEAPGIEPCLAIALSRSARTFVDKGADPGGQIPADGMIVVQVMMRVIAAQHPASSSNASTSRRSVGLSIAVEIRRTRPLRNTTSTAAALRAMTSTNLGVWRLRGSASSRRFQKYSLAPPGVLVQPTVSAEVSVATSDSFSGGAPHPLAATFEGNVLDRLFALNAQRFGRGAPPHFPAVRSF